MSHTYIFLQFIVTYIFNCSTYCVLYNKILVTVIKSSMLPAHYKQLYHSRDAICCEMFFCHIRTYTLTCTSSVYYVPYSRKSSKVQILENKTLDLISKNLANSDFHY